MSNEYYGSGGYSPSPGYGGGSGGYGGYGSQGSMGSGIGGLAGSVAGMFMPNPSDSANKYFNQIPGQLNSAFGPWMGQQQQQALNPYLQNGQQAGTNLNSQYNNLLNNPTGMFNQWGSTYHSSPGYQWQVGQDQNSANNTAAAGGMAGSQAEQQNMAATTNQLANQDYWQYVNNAQNLYTQGLQGEQGMYGIGANAANNMYSTGANMAAQYGTDMSQNLMNQGNLAYAGQINQNQNLMGGIGAIGSALFGSGGGGSGGGSLGGGSGGIIGDIAGFMGM